MRRFRYLRIALRATTPHWVIARTLPEWKIAPETIAASAFARVYGK